jgi:hypothetical protein
MKKIILTAAAVFTFCFANAQIKTEAGTFTKPTEGSLLFELSFSPNISGGSASAAIFSLPNFYGSDIPGVRARKFLSDTKAIRLTGNVTIDDSGNGEYAQSTLAVGIGVENHMKGAERLSTYWGYEGSIGYQNLSDLGTGDDTTTIGFSAQVFTGFDYYIMPNIYLGSEINYGIAILNTKPEGVTGSTSFKMQPNVLPVLRLGWRF